VCFERETQIIRYEHDFGGSMLRDELKDRGDQPVVLRIAGEPAGRKV